MKKSYLAACSLNGDVIRIVLIKEDNLEAARRSLYTASPGLFERESEGYAGATLHEVPNDVAEAVDLRPGDAQEWWLGETIPL